MSKPSSDFYWSLCPAPGSHGCWLICAGCPDGRSPRQKFSMTTNHNGFGNESICKARCQRSNLQLHGNVKVQLLQALMNSKKKYAGL